MTFKSVNRCTTSVTASRSSLTIWIKEPLPGHAATLALTRIDSFSLGGQRLLSIKTRRTTRAPTGKRTLVSALRWQVFSRWRLLRPTNSARVLSSQSLSRQKGSKRWWRMRAMQAYSVSSSNPFQIWPSRLHQRCRMLNLKKRSYSKLKLRAIFNLQGVLQLKLTLTLSKLTLRSWTSKQTLSNSTSVKSLSLSVMQSNKLQWESLRIRCPTSHKMKNKDTAIAR